MERHSSTPRPDWQAKLEEHGFAFHSVDGGYWNETASYRFTAAEIDVLDDATAELHAMCLDAIDRLVTAGRLEGFHLPLGYLPWIERSWRERDPHLYGRFDLAWNGQGAPKMLEYNADTPTALVEASVAQWHWLRAVQPDADQFNSIHEKLIERWRQTLSPSDLPVHFAAAGESIEDQTTIGYLADCALQAGHQVRLMPIEDIGWHHADRAFVDLADNPIRQLFKLYPTEWLIAEAFGPNLPDSGLRLFEPPWKVLLSSKALLPHLWEFNQGHPNLLPAFVGEPPAIGRWVSKPIYSREGANIVMVDQGRQTAASSGVYDEHPRIHQEATTLFTSEGRHAVIGSWVIGDQTAGIGIREDASLITGNLSQFVPHYFV